MLTPVNGQVGGQVVFESGSSAQPIARSRRITANATSFTDRQSHDHLPWRRGRQFGNNMPKALDSILGGWTTTELVRLNSGFPYIVYLSDTNQLGDLTHSARPSILPGVPLVNPLYSGSCPTGAGCQPYVNPSAFIRPALGQLGDAPRTLDNVRGPWSNSFDMSVQKNINLSESGKRRLQIRVDALNVLNHPTFAVFPNNAGGADFMGAPSTATLTTAAYNTWATANNQPLQSTTAGAAIYNGIVNMVNAQKTAGGALPANFFTIPAYRRKFLRKAGDFTYDITTLQGYKNYQLRNAYSTGFNARCITTTRRGYIQFGVKLYW